ncbi:hypothetical protein LCGC14_1794350, partial [marine sediment metagenome]
MTTPNLDNLQKEIDTLSSEEKQLLEKLQDIRVTKSVKQTNYKQLVEKMPMTVKVTKCLQKNGEVT